MKIAMPCQFGRICGSSFHVTTFSRRIKKIAISFASRVLAYLHDTLSWLDYFSNEFLNAYYT